MNLFKIPARYKNMTGNTGRQ